MWFRSFKRAIVLTRQGLPMKTRERFIFYKIPKRLNWTITAWRLSCRGVVASQLQYLGSWPKTQSSHYSMHAVWRSFALRHRSSFASRAALLCGQQWSFQARLSRVWSRITDTSLMMIQYLENPKWVPLGDSGHSGRLSAASSLLFTRFFALHYFFTTAVA
jgi:hypothetical protein